MELQTIVEHKCELCGELAVTQREMQEDPEGATEHIWLCDGCNIDIDELQLEAEFEADMEAFYE